jgi:hypothetical protein
MEINIRSDGVEISGYVNVVERASRVLQGRAGRFIERIKKGAFARALQRNANVRALLNHNTDRDLGGTNDGSLTLREDAVGLHARLYSRDPEIKQKAMDGHLIGWSFGFYDLPDGVDEGVEDGVRLRNVKDMDLKEVSVLDDTRTPAYEGTLLEVRDDNVCLIGDAMTDDVQLREIPDENPAPEQDPPVAIDYSKIEKLIEEMKGETK